MENGNNGNKSLSANKTNANNKAKQGGSAVAGFLLPLFLNIIGVIIVCAIGQPQTTKGMKCFFMVILSIIFPPLIIILIICAIAKKVRKRKAIARGTQTYKKQPSGK